jgi:hypothetical protein
LSGRVIKEFAIRGLTEILFQSQAEGPARLVEKEQSGHLFRPAQTLLPVYLQEYGCSMSAAVSNTAILFDNRYLQLILFLHIAYGRFAAMAYIQRNTASWPKPAGEASPLAPGKTKTKTKTKA